MPPLSPSQYWSFFVISNGFIAGKASLRVNGNCQTVDGGLLLDGSTSYLSSHLSRRNALSNPGGFLNGFSFGLKLKFPAAVLNSDNVRYILDTGGKSVSSPGLSLYLLNNKMILELATRDTRWKVSIVLWCFLHSLGFRYNLLSAQPRETWLLSKYDMKMDHSQTGVRYHTQSNTGFTRKKMCCAFYWIFLSRFLRDKAHVEWKTFRHTILNFNFTKFISVSICIFVLCGVG